MNTILEDPKPTPDEGETKGKTVVSPDQVISELKRQIGQRDRQIAEKEAVLQEILSSRSWRFMQLIQRIRLRLIPHDSHREQVMYSIWRGLRILRRDGLVQFTRRLGEKVSQKLNQVRLRARLRLRRRSAGDRTFMVNPVPQVTRVLPHTASVDIIICVHNALDDVQRCLESVVRCTTPPYNLILVDDGSAQPTQAYLADFALSQAALLLRNEQARGYTRAANQGLQASTAEVIVLLNSDTIVTPSWLDRLADCATSDPAIGMVGPLSNTASWQSIPDLYNAEGDWAENPLPQGLSLKDMGQRVAAYSGRVYPHVSFLNGFCLLIKRGLLNQIGLFDEERFGDGYAEENDYCLRAAKAGWTLAIADDAYIYHAQSRSYSPERRKQLVERSDKAFGDKYGYQIISEGIQRTRDDRSLLGCRARSQVMALRQQKIEEGKSHWEGLRLAFLLPISQFSGGGKLVMQEAIAMQKMGVLVDILNLQGHRSFFERTYPDLPIPRVYLPDPQQADSILLKYDAVIGTLYNSIYWMQNSFNQPNASHYLRAYYVLDYEPDFFPPDSANYKQAFDSYTLYPDLVRLTKTEWNRQAIKQRVGVDCHLVGSSVDIDLFRPRRRVDPSWPERPLRITAMIRPSTPRRQPALTMQVLAEISKRHGGKVEIILFGCEQDDPGFRALERGFPWLQAGVLAPPQLARLLNEVDIFVDFSSFQAMGQTAMEAMACGAAVIVPQDSGSSSFARHEGNALAVDTGSLDSCTAAVDRLIRDGQLRSNLQQRALFDICQDFPEIAAYNILQALFPDH